MTEQGAPRRVPGGKDVPPLIQKDVDDFIKETVDAFQTQRRVNVLRYKLDRNQMVEVGRNLAAGIVRLNIEIAEKEGEKRRSSLVLKIPQISLSFDNLEHFRIYEREVYVYEVVFPRLYEFWKYEKMSPHCYASTKSGYLALENLEESGFRLSPKDTAFNLTQFKVILKTLAQFHALSVRYFRTYGFAEFDLVTRIARDEDTDSMDLFSSLFVKVRKYIIPSLSEAELEKWRRFEENCATTIQNAYVLEDTYAGFSVMCHGDLQYNNVLLRNDNQECRLIDFQLCRRGSPMVDLIYLTVSSIQFEVFQQHRDAIFDSYLETLNGNLAEMGIALNYTRDELNADFERNKTFGIFILSILVPILATGLSRMKTWKEEQENQFDEFIKSEKYINLFRNWIGLL